MNFIHKAWCRMNVCAVWFPLMFLDYMVSLTCETTYEEQRYKSIEACKKVWNKYK